ncbi:MAG TPA: TRAP transporter small permease [Burkholderiales bacterium]|nr:TRAP transporter small permease [Burkholderiales bacterium]
MERFFARLERVLEPALAGLLAFITIGVFIQVVLRYLFAVSFLWGEELSLFAFIWCVFLGTAVCTWRHIHFSFDIFSELLTGRAAGAQRLLVDLCVLLVTVVIAVTGWQFSQMSVARLSPALGITLLVPTIIIPLSGVLMTLVILIDIARDCHQIWTGRAPERRSSAVDVA